MPRLGRTDLDVFPLCLGGNVFGWTASEQESFAILDAYAAAGGNFIDTADSYSAWVPGHVGGESETIIGRWMAARGCRNRMIIATKVGRVPGPARARAARTSAPALKRRSSASASIASICITRTPTTSTTPIDETLREFDALVREGKVRYIAASNFTAARLAAALATSAREGLARYVALQPHYNLVVRDEYEGAAVRCLRARGRGMCALLRARQGVSDRQVSAGRQRLRAREPKGRESISMHEGNACWPRSTRSPPRTTRLLPLSPSPGCSPSRPSPRRLRAREPQPSSRTCCRMATTTLTPEESTRLADTSRV